MNATELQQLAARLKSLRLSGILQHIDVLQTDRDFAVWIERIITIEEQERQKRHYEKLINGTRLKELDPVSNFEWSWPAKIDKALVQDLFTFDFLQEKMNVVFLGSAGLGKTMLAKNLVHEAAKKGHHAVFIEAVDLLSELLNETSRTGLDKVLKKYARPPLLAIDEVGYLSYDTRHADLLMRIVHMRHGKSSTIITTNRPFSEWREMFPNASSVTALLDRLTENCEVIQIEGSSYRSKRAQERNQVKAGKRSRATQGKVRTG